MGLVISCREGAPRGEVLTERHLQALWYDRAMRPALLYSQDGEEVRVVDPGTWNLEPGPDFKDALLEVGRTRRKVRGDVEIHLRPADWEAHGHGRDCAYDRVVAHVTWMEGPRPATLPAAAIPLPIGGLIASRVGFSPEQIDLSGYPFARLPVEDRPCRRQLGDNPDLAVAVLSAAGTLRLRAKARRFAALLAARPGERMQVFYEEFMGALGYRRNTGGFRVLAEMVPYALVASEPENAEVAFRSAAEFLEWDSRCTRPNNTPERRITAASALFRATGLAAFADARDFSPAGCRRLVANLAREGRMGRGRAAALLANVVVPMAMAEGRVAAPPDWLPSEDLSSPMRLTAFRMFGRDHNPSVYYLNNGLLMQGLLQIHREYCLELYPECAGCTVAELGAA